MRQARPATVWPAGLWRRGSSSGCRDRSLTAHHRRAAAARIDHLGWLPRPPTAGRGDLPLFPQFPLRLARRPEPSRLAHTTPRLSPEHPLRAGALDTRRRTCDEQRPAPEYEHDQPTRTPRTPGPPCEPQPHHPRTINQTMAINPYPSTTNMTNGLENRRFWTRPWSRCRAPGSAFERSRAAWLATVRGPGRWRRIGTRRRYRADPWAEFYRALAERDQAPQDELPCELVSVEVSLDQVADLRTGRAQAALGLPRLRPTRAQWPAFQAVGERLASHGAHGIVYASPARARAVCLCVFEAGFPSLKQSGEPLRIDVPPPPPRGLRT